MDTTITYAYATNNFYGKNNFVELLLIWCIKGRNEFPNVDNKVKLKYEYIVANLITNDLPYQLRILGLLPDLQKPA